MSAATAPTLIACSCGATLGERLGDYIIVRHRGREVVAAALVSIRCDRCGKVWRPT